MKKYYFVSYHFTSENGNGFGCSTNTIVDGIFRMNEVANSIKDRLNFKSVVIISFQEIQEEQLD